MSSTRVDGSTQRQDQTGVRHKNHAIPLLVVWLGAIPAALPATATSVQAAPTDDVRICDHYGDQVEAALQLPRGVLRAIGRVESGRRDPVGGSFAPWPWTLNANGQGRYLTDASAAAAAVRSLQAAGTANIDVGCYQVNLLHHPHAFQSIEAALEPATNAAYAGGFLRTLHARLGSWEAAVAAYHSATPERGEAYRQRVYGVWNGRPAEMLPSRQAGPVVIRISGPDIAGPDAPIRVWTPSRPGTAPARIALPPPSANVSRDSVTTARSAPPAGLPHEALVPAGLSSVVPPAPMR